MFPGKIKEISTGDSQIQPSEIRIGGNFKIKQDSHYFKHSQYNIENIKTSKELKKKQRNLNKIQTSTRISPSNFFSSAFLLQNLHASQIFVDMKSSMIRTFLQAHKFPLTSESIPSNMISTEGPSEFASEGQLDKENEDVIPITWIPLGVNPQTEEDITIEQKKSFIWSQKRQQWLWYKNLVIPSIEVKQMKFFQQESEFGCEKMKRIVRISCWKLLEDNSFEEVALLGEAYQQLSKQNVILSGLKFGETTFISKSSNFHIVLSIEETQSTTGEASIIAAFVSPCVYVEARRKAQKKTKKSLKSGLNSFFQAINQGNEENEKISDNSSLINGSTQKKDLDALHDYLLKDAVASEQIHPLYLIIKFPSILRLFLNSKNRPAPTSLYEILQKIQQIINCSFQNSQENNPIQTETISIYINVSNNRTHKLSKLEEKVISLAQQNGLTLLKNPCNLNNSGTTELILPSSIRNFFLSRLSDQGLKHQSFKQFFDLNIQALCLQSCSGFKRSALIEDFIKRDLDSNKAKVNTKSTRITKLGETWTQHISSISLNDFPPQPSIVKKVKTEKESKNCNAENLLENQQKISQGQEEKIIEPEKSNEQEAEIVCAPKISPIRLPVKSFSLFQRTGSSLKPTEKPFSINSSSLIPSESLIRSTSMYRPLSDQEVTTENEDDNLVRSLPSLSITAPWLDSLGSIPQISSNNTLYQLPQRFQNTYDQTQALTRILLQSNYLSSLDTNSSANKSQPVFLNPYQNCPLIPQSVQSTGHQFYFPYYNN